MQYLESWFVESALATPSITALLGKDSSGNPAIYPYHAQDADENIPFPHVTIAAFGQPTERGYFDENPLYATRVEGGKFAVCVWSRNTVDECHKIYFLLDNLLRGPASNPNNAHFSTYGLKRITKRDDLWDNVLKAYHLHAEYCAWIRYATVPPS